MKTDKEEETNKEIDIHGRAMRIDSAYRLLNESRISKADKKLILEFVKHKKISDHIGKLREASSINTLRLFAELWGNGLSGLKPKKRDEEGIEGSRKKLEGLLDRAYNRDIKIHNQPVKKPSDNTRKGFYIVLKMFYSWLVGRKHPEEFEWIKIPKVASEKLRVKDLLLPEDIEKLCSAATNARDILIPQLLFEAGGRIEEIASLTIEDIEPKDDGDFYLIHLNRSKKDRLGQEATRSIVIDDSGPALANYLRQHPLRNMKSAPLFVNTKNNSFMAYGAINKVLKKLKKISKLGKCVRPHWFRKSATCYLRNKKKMNDASIKTRHGWKPSSDMLDVYASEDMEEANKDFLIAKGKIRDNQIGEDKVQPSVCRYCEVRVPIGMNYCPNCRRPTNLTREEKELKVRIEKKLEEMIREKLIKEHPGLIDELETELKKEGF